MKVLVVGGGIGGLALALSLHAAGIEDVEVFEAVPEVRELGVGINVLPHAVRELTELGLGDDLAAAGVATAELVMFNKHGQRIWAEPRGVPAGYRWPQYSIHRGRLLGILHEAFLERLGAGRLHTGHRAVRCYQNSRSVSLEFDGQSAVRGDVVVAADGVHSAVRSQFYPGEGAPRWNGITMWRAVAEAEPFLSGATMVVAGHFAKRTVLYPISRPDRTGRLLLNIVFEAQTADGRPMPRQDWNHAVDDTELRAYFGSMRFPWLDVGQLIDAAPTWWQYPMVDRDPLPAWSFGRVTLLGDAAHPMYPVGSNGASQAIIDARTLAGSLALKPTIDAALAGYEAIRRPATAAIVLANREVAGEKCMELAEERAPDGFDDITDVFAPGELEQLSAAYKRTAGFDAASLNERPSLSVARRQVVTTSPSVGQA